MPTEHAAVIVYSGNIADADLLRCLLDSEGIASYLQNEVVGKVLPYVVEPGGVGAVKVLVAVEDLEKAKPIVEEYIREKSGHRNSREG